MNRNRVKSRLLNEDPKRMEKMMGNREAEIQQNIEAIDRRIFLSTKEARSYNGKESIFSRESLLRRTLHRLRFFSGRRMDR